MKVKLLEYTPNGEKLVASAAKLCYSPVGVDEIQENLSDKEVEKFLNNLINIGHESPIEHISFTFAAEGVSRSLTHQLVRHRIGSYSQQSQRYVKEDGFEYVTPKSIKKTSFIDGMYKEHMKETMRLYQIMIDRLVWEDLITGEHLVKVERIKEEIGMEESYDMEEIIDIISIFKIRHPGIYKKLSKKYLEDARYILPNATETKIVFTMNARTLLHFFRLRACNRAQWEIRELAEKMIKQVKEVYPVIFKNAGPSCITGPCPEGRMTCGKIDEVRKKYEQ